MCDEVLKKWREKWSDSGNIRDEWIQTFTAFISGAEGSESWRGKEMACKEICLAKEDYFWSSEWKRNADGKIVNGLVDNGRNKYESARSEAGKRASD